MEAHCIIAKENLKKMGIEFERLFSLGLNGWNILTEKYALELICEIDKIEEKSSDFYKVFFNKIKEKNTLAKKKFIVTTNIQNCKVSNFS